MDRKDLSYHPGRYGPSCYLRNSRRWVSGVHAEHMQPSLILTLAIVRAAVQHIDLVRYRTEDEGSGLGFLFANSWYLHVSVGGLLT